MCTFPLEPYIEFGGEVLPLHVVNCQVNISIVSIFHPQQFVTHPTTLKKFDGVEDDVIMLQFMFACYW